MRVGLRALKKPEPERAVLPRMTTSVSVVAPLL
jgi:hypothetical protein